MSDQAHWDNRYQEQNTPWETAGPSSELVRVVAEDRIAPCRAVDLGCGSGVHSVWLARQGVDVVGVDISPLAIKRARERAQREGVRVSFFAADLLAPTDLGSSFDFFFDRGCYHLVRKIDVGRYHQTVAGLMNAGALGLVLAGNARAPQTPGPPVVSEEEIRREWTSGPFEIVRLREFRFDESLQSATRPLGWSMLVRRITSPPTSPRSGFPG